MHLFIYLFIYFFVFFKFVLVVAFKDEVFFLRNIKTDSALVTESNCQINRRH